MSIIAMFIESGVLTQSEVDNALARRNAPDAVTLTPAPAYPKAMRLTGRCVNGCERDGGSRVHHVTRSGALCGVKPGRLSAGWDEVDSPVTCPACLKKMGTKQ